MRSSQWLPVAALLAGAAAFAPLAADAARVGTTAAVNPQATGTPPGGEMRTLTIGSDIVFEERIATAPGGQTQILFLDQSTLTVGPNAEVVIDRFVFDPNRSTGELAVSVTKGVFRFVGGKISAASGATIRTPTATLGIRGSVVLGDAEPFDIVFVAGQELTVTGEGGSLHMDARSVGRRVTLENGTPRDVGRATSERLRSLLASLNTPGSGGAPDVPNDAQAGLGLGSQLPGGGILQFSAGNQASEGSTPLLQPGTGNLGDELREVVQTGASEQIRSGSSPMVDLFSFLPGPPSGPRGPRTTGEVEGYGTTLSFAYDGVSDPLALLSTRTDLEGFIEAAGDPEPTLRIERDVTANHVDAEILGIRFGRGYTANSVFYDDRSFAAILTQGPPGGTPDGPRTMMVTANLFPPVNGVDQSKICSCDFLTWGYWAADLPGYGGSSNSERELFALGTWVAGVLPGPSDIPTTGTASYAGHAVGSVVDAGTYRMASGTMTGNFDFRTRTGGIQIDGFDGRNYAGTTSGVTNRMAVGLSSSDSLVGGHIVGSFARNGSDPVSGIIGDLILSGDNGSGGSYVGVGTIAGKRVGPGG
ncbi:MAG: FecR domain-containing protein [Alphaproteobacteria bacterium]